MSLRLLHILTNAEKKEDTLQRLQDLEVTEVHCLDAGEDRFLIQGLLYPEEVEEIMKEMDPAKNSGIFRIYLSEIEAAIPQVERKEDEEEKKEEEPKYFTVGKFIRFSKEELRTDVEGASNLNMNFILLIGLSSLVAGIGILKENMAIVIGAMVIAPFLGPNVALAFGATVGDLGMIRRSLGTALAGTGIAILISIIWGIVDPAVMTVDHDIFAEYRDIALALTCGIAGVLSIMTSQAASLVGVMVAAALLPPLIRAGLFLGGQLWLPAANSFLIFMVNVICLNLAGILTFYLAGIRPQSWWEEETARHHRRRALAISSVILVLLVVTISILRGLETGGG